MRYCHFGVSPVNYSDSDVFYSAAGSQFVALEPAKVLKIGQQMKF